MSRDERYFMSSVKIALRDRSLSPRRRGICSACSRGDTLVLMADKKKGLALQTVDKLNPLMKTVFNSLPSESEAEDE